MGLVEDKLVINPSVNDMVSEWTLGLLIFISVDITLLDCNLT